MAASATDRLAIPRGPITQREPAGLLPDPAWHKRSAGAGAKGERFYDWALVDDLTDAAGMRWVLVRRNHPTAEPAFYRRYAPSR